MPVLITDHAFLADPLRRDICNAKLDKAGAVQSCGRPLREHASMIGHGHVVRAGEFYGRCAEVLVDRGYQVLVRLTPRGRTLTLNRHDFDPGCSRNPRNAEGEAVHPDREAA